MSNYPYIGYFIDYEFYGEDEFFKDCFNKDDTQKLEEIYKNNTFKYIRIINTFEDDHEICINVIVDGIKCSFMWITLEFAADVVYAAKGNKKAKKSVMKYIKDCMKSYIERT